MTAGIISSLAVTNSVVLVSGYYSNRRVLKTYPQTFSFDLHRTLLYHIQELFGHFVSLCKMTF